MMGEILVGLVGKTLADAYKASKIDEQTTKKNIKAFTNIANAQQKVEQHQQRLFELLEINVRRKNAILQNHIMLFIKQYEVFRQVEFEKGRGIEELNLIENIKHQLTQYVSTPQIASGQIMTDKQLLINFAFRGIGGLMVKESEQNLQLAAQNLSKSHVVQAQADSICISLDGIGEKVQIITNLLQRLGALYMLSIRELEQIVVRNGIIAMKYTQQDIDAINTSMHLTKLIFRIINTPLIDQNGQIEQAALACITEGQQYLSQL